MHYDISSKILIDKCREEILRRMVGLSVVESTLLEQLPQETVSLRRSDFPILVTDEKGLRRLVLLEVQSEWEREVPLRLLDYRSRHLLRQMGAEAISCVLLLRPSGEARDHYEDNEITYHFRLVKVYELDAKEIIREGIVCLMPFVPLMRHGEELMEEADRLVYESPLPRADKADMLTAMAILSGLVSSRLPRVLLSRRRDIMIESAAYDLIKQEGKQEGKILEAREAVLDILDARFDAVPQSIITKLQDVKHLHVLKSLRRKSATIGTMEEFKQLLERSSA